MIARRTFSSPVGELTAGTSEEGICFLEFDAAPDPEELPGDHPFLDQLEQELREYFDRRRTVFEVPLAPSGSDFQQRVWNALLEIPYGVTRTYMDQSRRLGDVKAIRAVAHANGQNRIAILIPCHRVIGSDGSLTGYAGGIWRKKFLLELESRQPTLF